MPLLSVRKPLMRMLIVISIAVVTGGLSRLRLDPDILSTLPRDLPEARALKLLRDGFSGGDELVLAMEASDAALAKLAADSLARRLASEHALCRRVRDGDAWEKPETAGALLAWALLNAAPDRLAMLKDRVDSEENLRAHLDHVLDLLAASPDPAIVQRRQYDPLGLLDGVDLERMRALQDIGEGATSADGRFRLLFVSPQNALRGYREAARWLEALDRVVADWRQAEAPFAGVTLRRTGEPAFMAEIGTGIERDLSGTLSLGTGLIAALFWLLHRRWLPLMWLLLLLGVSLLLSLSLAGLILGKLTVMSLGFASIVLGIVVDYGVLVLQEAADHPDRGAEALRRGVMRGIMGGAATTAAVFFALLFIGLPGLSELGMLVGINVIAGAVVMLTFMPHLAARMRFAAPTSKGVRGNRVRQRHAILGTVVLVVGVAVVLLWRGLPPFAGGAEALRPARSDAEAAWQIVQQRLGKAEQATVPVVLHGAEQELRELANRAAHVLEAAKSEKLIRDFALPSMLMLDRSHQQANRPLLQWFVEKRSDLRDGVLRAGFTEEALTLFDRVMDAWQLCLASRYPIPPQRSAAAGVLQRFFGTAASGSDDPPSHAMLGFVAMDGQPGSPDAGKLRALEARLDALPGVRPASWETLGHALSKRVRHDIAHEMLPLVAILLLMLALTYRNIRDVLLSCALLALGIAALAATMSLLGQSWNLASLAALPLLLGTGIDYGIHILLALRRGRNDIRLVRATTGRAVFFCGATTIIGFMSLVVAENRGVASLGGACAAGIGWIMLLVLWLLPHWRCWIWGTCGAGSAGTCAAPGSSS